MKIDGSNPFPEIRPLKSPSGAGATESHEVDGTPVSDAANLASSSLVNQLAAKVKQLPEIRQDRVEALRKAIQSGQYHVSDRQIAEAISTHLFGTGSSKK